MLSRRLPAMSFAAAAAIVLSANPTAHVPAVLAASAAPAPGVLRVALIRHDGIVQGIGTGLTFDRAAVDKALAAAPAKLPDPLPSGALVGYNRADDFLVLLEKGATPDSAFLTVDANMNRDLRDDARVELRVDRASDEGTIVRIKRTYPGVSPAEVWLPYRFTLSSRRNQAGEVVATVGVSPAYRMEGTARIRGREFLIELSDFNGYGRFDRSNLSRGSVLRAYPSDIERTEAPFFWGYEIFPLGDEFYEIRDEALDGSWVDLARNALPSPAIGRAAPALGVREAAGKTFRLAEYRGRYLLLDFWPSWCGPCVAEFDNIKRAIASYASRSLAVVSINLDAGKGLDSARKIIADKALPWRQVLPGQGYFLPLYQMLGQLPERRAAFPLYVLIGPDGSVRFATNTFSRMERAIGAAVGIPPRPDVLFVPLARPSGSTRLGTPRPVDFGSEGLRAVLRDPRLKLPADLPREARVGRLPNGRILIVKPGGRPGTLALRIDAKNDLDLTKGSDVEIPMLAALPTNPAEAARAVFPTPFASGAEAYMPFYFFARRTADGPAEVFYWGYATSASGLFVAAGAEYRIDVADPTDDLVFTAEDARAPGFLTVKKKQGRDWVTVPAGPAGIAIGGRLYRLARVDDDGLLVELEPEK